MVKDARKKTRTGRIRSINQPEVITIQQYHDSIPSSIVYRDQKINITSVLDVWEITDEWWRRNYINRRYYQVTAEIGTRIIIFQDMVSGEWYKQNSY